MLKIELKQGYWLEIDPVGISAIELVAHYRDLRSNISNLNWVSNELNVESVSDDNVLEFDTLEELLQAVITICGWRNTDIVKALREDRKEGEWPSTT